MPVTCFKIGTKILCLKDGIERYIPVEDMRHGDLVRTYKHGLIPVHKIGSGYLYNIRERQRLVERLYVCHPEKYNELTEELILTGSHSILVDSLTARQELKTKNLTDEVVRTDGKYHLLTCLDERADPYKVMGTFTIYHLALESPDKDRKYGIFANGLLVESCSINIMNTMLL
jgi:hypothetical protein